MQDSPSSNNLNQQQILDNDINLAGITFSQIVGNILGDMMENREGPQQGTGIIFGINIEDAGDSLQQLFGGVIQNAIELAVNGNLD